MADHLGLEGRGANYLRSVAHMIRAEIDPATLPDTESDLLFDVYAVLALSLGASVSEADVHNAWVAWMLTEDPDHPALVPYNKLDAETAAADAPFVAAIRSVALQLDRAGPRSHRHATS